MGPFRIRRNADELAKSDLSEAKGATVGYADNHLASGSGAWNSEGVLAYDAVVLSNKAAKVQVDPAVQWKLAEVQGEDKKDVQELTFKLPVIGSYYPNTAHGGAWGFAAAPYLNTDFGIRHRILGAEASLEYVGPLRFAEDRDGYRARLLEAVLNTQASLRNHNITSNRVHLIVWPETCQPSGFSIAVEAGPSITVSRLRP